MVLLFSAKTGYSLSNTSPTSSKASGMGNAFVSQYDESSIFYNQAGLANIKKTSIAFYYENRFLVKELSARSGLIAFTTGSGNFAIHYNTTGPSQWSESIAGISYSRYLSKKLSTGLKFNYFGIRLPEENTTVATVSFELGAIYQLNNKTFFGVHIANPYAPAITTLNYSVQIPWDLTVGGHTNFSENFTLSYEIEKIESQSSILKVGVQWEATKNVFVRGGLNTNPSQFFTGFGYKTQFLSIDTAFSYHQYLGYSPSVALKFSFF
jgi:hypothetical protein